ncbi:hypothetical protein [Bradyrhizobium sp.]|uniref:hypothetical protein n=1 Tax=Bradyrhizobium sp. TaxID=376 RepID=UPI0027364F4C|nr:hypothetical protein [Bradyrhizobium sp.]MDP3078656.1 hypothetical protein [Bradyrhizobium sp.]
MNRITFARITDRASYTHFVEADGTIIALQSIHIGRETKVGVVFGQEFPTDDQRQAIAHLANLATGIDPTVEIVFSEGTSPFPGAIPANHPFAEYCTS